MVEHAPVGGRGGVVELVDDDVVEVVGGEAVEVALPAQRLDRGAEDVDFGVLLLAVVEADRGIGPDAQERLGRLAEDLFAVGDEAGRPCPLLCAHRELL